MAEDLGGVLGREWDDVLLSMICQHNSNADPLGLWGNEMGRLTVKYWHESRKRQPPYSDHRFSGTTDSGMRFGQARKENLHVFNYCQ